MNYLDKDDKIETALKQGETEFTYTPNPVSWIKLFKFYNWDNPFNEILYFYKIEESILWAISFGTTNDDGYIVGSGKLNGKTRAFLLTPV